MRSRTAVWALSLVFFAGCDSGAVMPVEPELSTQPVDGTYDAVGMPLTVAGYGVVNSVRLLIKTTDSGTLYGLGWSWTPTCPTWETACKDAACTNWSGRVLEGGRLQYREGVFNGTTLWMEEFQDTVTFQKR